MAPEQASANQAWNGTLYKYKAKSSSLGGLETAFNVFVPGKGSRYPVLFYLAGLTCTEDTGAQKGGFLRDAAEHGIALVFPDTSPRGAGVKDEDESWDFGTGAGFYIDATADAWSKHYNMESYLTRELLELLKQTDLPLDLERCSIFGHSMGGHGALSLYLKYPNLYRAASAFAPICEPTKCPWGEKAFKGYLTGGLKEGEAHDTIALIENWPKRHKLLILVDSGTADNFYKDGQLRPERLQEVAKAKGYGEDQIAVRLREGYDHSYWFIQTFGPEHIAWHAKHLKA